MTKGDTLAGSTRPTDAPKTWTGRQTVDLALLCYVHPSPRPGTRLARPDPRPLLESTLCRVPAEAGGASDTGLLPLSPTTLGQLN